VKKLSAFLFAIVLMFGMAGNATATLIDRGGGLIYDDVLKITWLQDANYAATDLSDAWLNSVIGVEIDGHSIVASDFHEDSGVYTGKMRWWGAMVWVENLIYYDSIRDVYWNDWRLPSSLNQDGTGPCYNFCNDSEMGRLFYIDGATPSSQGEFNNIQPYLYWSSTEYEQIDIYAWYFNFDYGKQDPDYKYNFNFALAVRDGDVAPIPEPTTMLLLGTGFIGLAGARRKFKK